MPERIYVPDPDPFEERRQIAESVADLHYTMGTIVDNADKFIPGEAVEEFKAAWDEDVNPAMRHLVNNLLPLRPDVPPPPTPPIPIEVLQRHQLTGKAGKAKRATLARFKDRFFMFWNSCPLTEETRASAREAAVEYLDFGAIFTSSIPGYEQVEEALCLGKKLIEFRINRGV